MIDKNEVLRYLGYRGQKLETGIENSIHECVTECEKIAKPKYIYKIYNIDKSNSHVELIKTNITLLGKDIHDHLEHCEKAVLMAATLGIDIDKQIAAYSSNDLSKALILDACATTLIESVCDGCEDEIKKEAAKKGYYINFRFSPGYGDFPIEQQLKFTALLDTQRKLGLTCSDNNILIPRKSVTAVIGFLKDNIEVVTPES